MSDRPSVEEVLAEANLQWCRLPTIDPPPMHDFYVNALAAAAEDGPLIDRDRGIAVIRLDPELAGDLRWGADHLAPSEITMTPPPRGSLRWAAAVMDAAARIIGGEQSDGD